MLDAALAQGSARVTEVSASGHVPELRFVNDGDWPVLLLDGEELIGAMQNRILNLTLLAPAHKTILIPVSCVEAGRWHAESAEFAGARRTHFATGRARKAADVSDSLRRRNSRETDQGRVWADIESKSRRMGVSSGTRAAAALYEGHRDRLDGFQGAFSPQPGQCGALFAINGRLVGLDLFDSPATLAATLAKLVESYALDAIDLVDDLPPRTPALPEAWLHAIAGAGVERFPAIGEGEDWRLSGPGLAGGALVKDARLIHLCAFRVAGEDSGDGADPERPTGDDTPSNNLHLALASDRRLVRAAGHSRRYLHLRLTAPRGSQERAPVDLALVLDRSGSMGGGKWPHARDAALAAIGRLGSRDRVALVTFDDQIDIPLPLTPVTADTRRQAASALEGIGPRGMTNLGEAWLTGCGLIGRDGTAERLHRCLLLTDGQANVGLTHPVELAGHAGSLLRLGVRTSTFGLGDDYNEELLGQMADAGGGACHDIAGAEGIQAAIARELGDALEVVCADTRVRLTWQADLQVRVLSTWEAQPGPGSLLILPGDLVSEQVLDLLVEIRFPAGALDQACAIQVQVSDGEDPLAHGEYRWTWVDSARRRAQARDSAVEQRVAAFLAHQARRDAAARTRDGSLQGARDVLSRVAEDLRRYGQEDQQIQALAASLANEIESHLAPMSPRDIKQRIYSARSAMKSRKEDGGRHRAEDPAEFHRAGPGLHYLPILDSPERAAQARRLRAIPRQRTAALGKATMTALMTGTYAVAAGHPLDWRDAVQAAVAAKLSLPPNMSPPQAPSVRYPRTQIQVVNDSTLAVARRLTDQGLRVLALNFGNGAEPGGGFLQGNRGQEGLLCRSSALYATLQGDAMYQAHLARPLPDSTDWAILSPEVPVFRTDEGLPLDRPWPLSFITCAAPYAPRLGQEPSAHLMADRIRRVMAIARAFGYEALVLGAWGCGTYSNDTVRVAALWHAALQEQAGTFAEVVFAVADGSSERAFLAPFAAEFAPKP